MTVQGPGSASPIRIERRPGRGWRLSCSQWLPGPPETVFPFFGSARNLEWITPPFLRFRIRRVRGEAGSRIDYTLAPVGERLSVGIVQHEEGQRVLDAQLWGRRVPLTTRTLTSSLLRYPLVTMKTIVSIHAEAARLYLKGIPFLNHPGPTDAHREQRARLAADGAEQRLSGLPAARRSKRP